MINSKEFINYLLESDFPNTSYIAFKPYSKPNSNNNSQNKYKVDFNNKYKRKFLLDYPQKDKITENTANTLFFQSMDFMSKFQQNLINNNIESYISGGGAQKLYAISINDYKKKNFLITRDYDLYLYYDNKNITYQVLLNNINTIFDSVILSLKSPNYTFIELYILLHFDNTKVFTKVIEIFLQNNFDLQSYIPNFETNIYTFKFVKVINKELCIKLKLKFSKIDDLLNESIYSYSKMSIYYNKRLDNKKFKLLNKYIPIEILVKNKHNSNIELMKSTLKIKQNVFYIYNLNSILYMLMHMYYKYNTLSAIDKYIQKKINDHKNKRDEARLDDFFMIYSTILYKSLSKEELKKILDKMKNMKNNFIQNIEHISDFLMIESLFIKNNNNRGNKRIINNTIKNLNSPFKNNQLNAFGKL